MEALVQVVFKDNDVDVALETTNLLLELCRTLLSNQPLRNIRVDSDFFQEWILRTEGSTDILYAIGFEEGDDCFYLPENFEKTKVLDLQRSLNAAKSVSVNTLRLQRNKTPHILFSDLPHTSNETEQRFLSEAVSCLSQVQQHESPALQQKALNLLPLEELKSKARGETNLTSGSEDTVCLKDLLLLELLKWFKYSFFHWVDVPKCPWCGGSCSSGDKATPGPTDLLWGAQRVEAYMCQKCQVNVRFPRFNDPGHLLVTRKGRCGEWANCFLLFLRALGYEARLVNDNKDHVWTEAYSESQKRWLHCDPCECACDKPLTYEKGWRKDLSFVFAYASDHFQDVTWRYISDHRSAIVKRRGIREAWLIDFIQACTLQLQRTLAIGQRETLLQRRLNELVEFLTPPLSTSPSDVQERTSGSLAWRLARGEAHSDIPKLPGFAFKPLPMEVSVKKMEVVYSPVTDSYKRLMLKLEEGNLKGWRSGAWDHRNIFRKEEYDWKQVYLCVQEGSSDGHLTWRFIMQDTCKVHCVKVICKSTVFQKGLVWWSLSDGKRTVDIQNGQLTECFAFDGATELTLSARLVCGESWQHAQLFRTDTSKGHTSNSEFPLHVSITFH